MSTEPQSVMLASTPKAPCLPGSAGLGPSYPLSPTSKDSHQVLSPFSRSLIRRSRGSVIDLMSAIILAS